MGNSGTCPDVSSDVSFNQINIKARNTCQEADKVRPIEVSNE